MKQFDDINKAVKTAEIAKSKLAIKILAMPDNPGVTYVGKNSFIIKSNVLLATPSFNLCPDYYDFKAQCRAIIKVMQKRPMENLQAWFERIINDMELTPYPYRFLLHPEVVMHLQKIMERE